MRLTTKSSAFVMLLTRLTIFVTLIGYSLSFYNVIQCEFTTHVHAAVTAIDTHLVSRGVVASTPQIDELVVPVDTVRIELLQGESVVYDHSCISSYRPAGANNPYRKITVPLVKHPGMSLCLVYQDPMGNYFHLLPTTVPFMIAIALTILMLFLLVRWPQCQPSSQELLGIRSIRILNDERGPNVRGAVYEWPARTSSAFDMLLTEVQDVRGQCSRLDMLIRSYAAQDTKTGLSNRSFFDNQLAILLEDQEKVGPHGVMMTVRLLDFILLHDSWGITLAEEQIPMLINLLSTFMTRYSGALLARYHHGDLAILLPHRTLKEAESIAGQLLKAVDALPVSKVIDRVDMVHIGICICRSGQSPEQMTDYAEAAIRNSVLQGGNSWSIYDDSLSEKDRGNAYRRTLIEQMLSQGGPRIYQKSVAMRGGRVRHRELMCHIFDSNEEVISVEYIPMALQFGLAEEYDRLQISRLILLLGYWPQENLAMQTTVESLTRPRFQRRLRDTLTQCEKPLCKRIIIEPAEADACQHISRLQPAIRLMNASGVRIAVAQAELTLVSTSWIKEFNVELLKLHPSLVRDIDKRAENQPLVQSLVEACSETPTQVYATGVRSHSEWHMLTERGVVGG